MSAAEQSPATPVLSLQPHPEPGTIVLVLGGSIAPADVGRLARRALRLLRSGDAYRVVCDVGAISAPDAVTIDALARLQLVAHRLGKELLLRRAASELCELLALAGLSDVLLCVA